MTRSFHTYPEYDADIRAAFDELAAQFGFQLISGPFTMTRYVGPYVELCFGTDLQHPELYIHLKGKQPFFLEEILKGAGLPPVPAIHAASAREEAQALLNAWAEKLGPLLPALSKGDFSGLQLQPLEEFEYEYKLRKYIRKHAPVGHIIYTQLWGENWRQYAEAYLMETGGKLE